MEMPIFNDRLLRPAAGKGGYTVAPSQPVVTNSSGGVDIFNSGSDYYNIIMDPAASASNGNSVVWQYSNGTPIIYDKFDSANTKPVTEKTPQQKAIEDYDRAMGVLGRSRG